MKTTIIRTTYGVRATWKRGWFRPAGYIWVGMTSKGRPDIFIVKKKLKKPLASIPNMKKMRKLLAKYGIDICTHLTQRERIRFYKYFNNKADRKAK